MRVRPRRETRGVSRSKCGDLITACVPVTWATSIIVNESTDAIDYYDGFGTTELVVGVRAYQWGWEYYYPKDIDLNYNIRNNYSSFIGNSLKYSKTSEVNFKSNNLWKFYQNKSTDHVVTPAYLIASPLDNYKLFNFLSFNDAGSNPTQEPNSFKRVRAFSKTYTSNLSFVPDEYSTKFKNISSLYLNDLHFDDSYLYGLKRQHNFLTSKAILNNQTTFINLSSFNKIVNFNYKNDLKFNNNYIPSQALYLLKKPSNKDSLTNDSLKTLNLFTSNFLNQNLIFFKNYVNYNKNLDFFNDNSDKKKTKYPFFKMFNLKINKLKRQNLLNLNKLNNFNDIDLLESNLNLNNFFNNKNKSFKTLTPFSPNASVTLPNRYVRNFLQNKPNLSNYNLSYRLNPLNNYIFFNNTNLGFNSLSLLKINSTNWVDPVITNKLASVKISFDYPYSPISSSNPSIHTLDYDNLNNTDVENSPSALQGREEIMPTFLANIYWNFYWANSSLDWRVLNNNLYHSIHKSLYLPMFNFYYDYDFRNWQSLELLEDTFWESTFSAYSHDEYVSINKNFYNYEFFKKIYSFFNIMDRIVFFKYKIATKPFFLDTNSLGEYYANPINLDEVLSPSDLMPTKNFFVFPASLILNNMDDTYESLKYLNYLFNSNDKFFLNSSFAGFRPYSYFFVFDCFRSDIDEFSWFVDEALPVPFFLKQIDYITTGFFFNKYNIDSLLFYSNYYVNTDLDNSTPALNSTKSRRLANNTNLRGSVKNSIVNFNAIQKVYKTRFDENRSNTKISDFGNFFIKQTFVSSPRIQYEKLLGKTKENFFKINFYKNNFQPFVNSLYASSTSLNYYFYDFPFLMALKSDSSRYLWFDWFAKWGLYEVQPSSSSRYAIYGMPYFSKNFEYTTMDSENLNETETYLIRLAHARKNYLPNWTYTPYFYAKNTSWFKTNLIYEILNQDTTDLTITNALLSEMSWYWNKNKHFNLPSNHFFPSHSGIVTYSKLGWKPNSSVQSYYYSVSTLIDILTKREYLYREFLMNNKKIVHLPSYFTTHPSNPLIEELKASFLFSNPNIYLNEFHRDSFYFSLNFFNFNILKSFLISTNSFINLNLLTNYIFLYFFDDISAYKTPQDSELYKSQYRPLKKGITNMIRLHATGAVAMPIEIRLQVLASSKDVIHSWAIPSAGIKIDCVPGYSSHKVMIFLVSGIFWGQCMEICGRYHHWMPIIIYFMKRDLFFLWCTHFVFLSGSNNMWNINDRNFTNYAKTVSFDKYSWLSELDL